MEVVQKNSVKVPNSVIVSGVTGTEAKTSTDTSYHIKALASVYSPVASKTATQTYLSELKKIAKQTGKDFAAVLREEISIIGEAVDLDDSET